MTINHAGPSPAPKIKDEEPTQIRTTKQQLKNLSNFAKAFSELKDLSRVQLVSRAIDFFIAKYGLFELVRVTTPKNNEQEEGQ